MNRYIVCGIEINTDFEFFYYNMQQTSFNDINPIRAKIDFVFKKNDLAINISRNDVISNQEGFFLYYSQKGYYHIDIAGSIIVAYFYDEKDVILTFSNLPLSLIALIHGAIPLHCNSILDAQGDVSLILGDKGAGKSTLSYYLQKKGLQLFSDDITIVWPYANDIIIFNGFNTVKIEKEMRQTIEERCLLIKDYKYFVEMPSPYKYSRKIKEILVLHKNTESCIKKISPELCKIQLKIHTVGNTPFKKLIYNNFDIYNRIIDNASMCSVATIKNGLNYLQENVQLLYGTILTSCF